MIVFNFQSYFKSARIWIFFTYNYSKRWREAKENAIHICNCISKICFGNNPIPIVCVSYNTWQSNFNGKKRKETQSETWAFSWYLFIYYHFLRLMNQKLSHPMLNLKWFPTGFHFHYLKFQMLSLQQVVSWTNA